MSKKKLFIWILFILYAIVMLWLLFGQRIGFVSYDDYFLRLKAKINLIPFKTIAEYIEMYKENIHYSLVRHSIINNIGNIVVFIPLGCFLPTLFDKLKKLKPFFLCCTAIIACVELIQYFTLLGSLDIDDYILNILGVLIGFAAYKLASKVSA